jgi:multidrug efflux pump subunit AcrB
MQKPDHQPRERLSVVAYVLQHPYTVVAVLTLVCILGIGAGLKMPVDIFPEIDIPVVSVVWTYNGMNAEDIQNRILTLHERQWPRWSTISRASRQPAMTVSASRRSICMRVPT